MIVVRIKYICSYKHKHILHVVNILQLFMVNKNYFVL